MILVVEDNAVEQRKLEYLLGTAKLPFRMLKDNAETEPFLAQGEVSLIILDLLTPGRNGIDFLRWKHGTEFVDVPVLVVTHYSQECLDFAPDGSVARYLKKPYVASDLLKLVGECLKGGNP